MSKVLPVTLLVVGAFGLGAAAHREFEAPTDRSYWTITRMTVPRPADRESLQAVLKESAGSRAEVRKQGISRYWLMEQAGGSGAQIVVLTRYPSWAAIQDTTLSFTDAVYRRTMPDSAKRAAWRRRSSELIGGAGQERSLWREFAGPDH